MTLAIVAESAPLQANEDGVILVGKTRVTLDNVLAVFNQGATAEEIAYRYPSLNLADVYATIAFYLKHQSEVEPYLQQRRQQSQEIRDMNQARFDPQGLRERLLARKTYPPKHCCVMNIYPTLVDHLCYLLIREWVAEET